MLIGEDVKIARTLLGWPPSQLARELSMTATTIKNFETGKRSLSALEISVLRRLLEAAGIEFKNGGERGGDATTGEVMVVIKLKRRATLDRRLRDNRSRNLDLPDSFTDAFGAQRHGRE
jgi:transcriptional regulator with XRE-family HTH domain